MLKIIANKFDGAGVYKYLIDSRLAKRINGGSRVACLEIISPDLTQARKSDCGARDVVSEVAG